MDPDILGACRQGNPQAQKKLYDTYAKAMYNICYRILKSEPEAEDALQEAFLKAFKKIHEFRGESSIGAWIKRIVVNQALQQLKSQQRLSLENEQEVLVAEEAADENSWVLEIESIKKQILALPDGFRVVLSLYLLEGYDHQEIADILGISVSTSKSQYKRAKEKLRYRLKAKLNHEG